MTTYTYRLPWPPSMNTYWRRGPHVTYLTAKAKEFRHFVFSEVVEQNARDRHTPFIKLEGRLAVLIELTAPDKRKRDLDNHVKAVLDALEHAGVYENDSQIDELRVKRLHVESPGCCDVTITELTTEAT